MKDQRDTKNLHTLAQIEAAGNRILSISATKGELLTKRGKTLTYWNEPESGYWFPYHARTPDYTP